MTSKRKREERMRGDAIEPDQMFSYISAAQRVPQDHPLRAIRRMVDTVLGELSLSFEKLHSHTGRPSIPPESRRFVQEAPSVLRLVGFSDHRIAWKPIQGTKHASALSTIFHASGERSL
jgi:hypothetical protein